MPTLGRDVERRAPIIQLKINVAARFNQLFRDGRMTICDCAVECCVTNLLRKINAAASFNELFCD
jgi:hypothetical protein